jgi:DNA primase
MQAAIDEIKKRIDIVDYIGALVPLKKMGRTYKANCPFHHEKTPSFVVSGERQIWRCFGACQDGGDVISFLMKWDNLTFFEALKELAHQIGLTLDTTKVEDRQWKQKETLLKINDFAAKYYHYLLTKHESGKAGKEYVEKRGLNAGMIDTFQLGYAPNSWDSLLKFLIKKGFSEKDIESAGLVIQSPKNPQRYYDRFRGRLMFPIIDARQNILGFSGRLLVNEDKQAKYVNTPETPIYRKRETLYGMHVAHEAIRHEKMAIITEGEFDMLSCFKHGMKHAVAIKGSAFTKDQLMLLKRYTTHLVLALDADFSGTQTTLKAIKDAEDMDFRIDVIHSNLGKDPDEALATDPIAYKKLFKKPIPIYDFIIQTAVSRHNSEDPYEKKEIVEDVLPFISSISNPIVKSHYIKRLAELIKADTRDIETAIRKLTYKESTKRTHIPTRTDTKTERHETIEKYILSAILQSEDPLQLRDSVMNILDAADFTIPSYAEIFGALLQYKSKTFAVDVFSHAFSGPLQSVLDDLFLNDISAEKEHDDKEKMFKKTAYELKKLSLKNRLKQSLAEGEKNESVQDLMANLTRVEKELNIL